MKEKRKILLISDDLRVHTGVARMCRSLISGTIDEWEWIQIAVLPKHPHDRQEARHTIGRSEVKLYMCSGFQQPILLRKIIDCDRPDVLIVFQDPRHWNWLFAMSHEIRKSIPIVYYTVWDNLPDPVNNIDQYRRSDMVFCISRLTYGVVKRLMKDFKEPWQIQYLPHGVDSSSFYPIEEDQKEDFGLVDHIRKTLFHSAEFCVLVNNVHQRRKRIPDAILSFYGLPNEVMSKSSMLIHSIAKEDGRSDLERLRRIIDLRSSAKIVIDRLNYSDEWLNAIYNAADVTVNLASEEGFGLTTLESLMAGTPIIATVTGGLQDQFGLRWREGDLIREEDYVSAESFGKRHWKAKITWGNWVEPLWSSATSCGSTEETPLMFQDYVSTDDATEAIEKFFEMDRKERSAAGKAGHEYASMYFSSERMVQGFRDGVDLLFDRLKDRF